MSNSEIAAMFLMGTNIGKFSPVERAKMINGALDAAEEMGRIADLREDKRRAAQLPPDRFPTK